MKKTLLVCALVLATTLPAAAQLDTLWTATYGGSSNDGARSFLSTSDGGFLVIGYTYSYGAGGVDAYLVKTDASGNEAWARTYGGSGRDFGFDLCESGDGGYVLTGFTTSLGAGKKDVYVVRIDASGDTLWTRTYGGVEDDAGAAVCRTSTGHYVVTGRTQSFGAGLADVYLLKLDANGDTLWTRTAGGDQPDWGSDLCETADGCYLVAGSYGSHSSNSDGYLLKMDARGNVVWEQYYGNDSNADWGIGVYATPDSGAALVGYRDVHLQDPAESYIIRVDADGERIWGIKFTEFFYQYARSVCPTPDGGFLVCGVTKDPATQENDLELVRVTNDGRREWTQALGGEITDWGNAIVALPPDRYVVAGHTESYGAGGFDAWLLELRDPAIGTPELGSTSPGPFLSPLRPNPVRDVVAFSVQVPHQGSLEVTVVNAVGEKVRTLHRGVVGPGRHDFAWDARNEAAQRVAGGVYFVVADGVVKGMRRLVLIH
jgi:hypothetical protein